MCFLFFFNDTATTEIYTLSLHDALPISNVGWMQESDQLQIELENFPDEMRPMQAASAEAPFSSPDYLFEVKWDRSEEHTSELQSPDHIVCRLLLEKKKFPLRTTQTGMLS